MRETMTCGVIRDLIPLCAEGLCSEESRRVIEEHVKTCEHCRRLCEQLPGNPEPESASVPAEGEALRKVNRRLKIGKAWLYLLIAVLLGLAYLTVGEFAKNEHIQSFETLWRNVEVYPVAKAIAYGEFEKFEEQLSTGAHIDLLTYPYYEEITAHDIENLKTTYQAAYGDTSVQNITMHSYYTNLYADRSHIIGTEVNIRYRNGEELQLVLGKGIDGLFISEVGMFSGGTAQAGFRDALYFANHHEFHPRGLVETLYTIRSRPATLDGKLSMIRNRFAPECRDAVQEGLCAYLDKGYLTDDCTLTTPRYDKDRGALYYEFTLTGTDAQGAALLTGRIYVDYDGMKLPENLKVYKDGCTDGLADALMGIFGN